MNDVERQAQADGYTDGFAGLRSTKYSAYSNLKTAYDRGWKLGHDDIERLEREEFTHYDQSQR